MFDLYVGNTSLTADPRFSVINVDGLNPAPTTINTSANSGDGAIFNSAFLQSRNIVITVVFNGDIEDTRKAFYTLFPLKSRITLRVKNKNYDVRIDGYVEAIDIALFSQRQQAQVSIICPDPFFINSGSTVSRSSVVSGVPTITVTNAGDFEVGFYLNVTFTGDVENLNVRNTTTGKSFIVSATFQNNDNFILKTQRNELSVQRWRSGVTTTLLSSVDGGSDWIRLAKGENVLTITATSGMANIGTGTLLHYALYGGV
jgi:hypothetical protein